MKLLSQISDSEHHSRSTAYDIDMFLKRLPKGKEVNITCGIHDPNFITDKSIQNITATWQYLKRHHISTSRL